MINLKEIINEAIAEKLYESKYDTDFKKIEWLKNYDIKNVSVFGNKLYLTLEDADFHEVTIKYMFKKTPRGIDIEGEWTRETSSSNSRDDYGKTAKVTVKTLEDAISLFSKSLSNNDMKKVVTKMKNLKV